jgi:hypothetical protein
VLIIVCYIVVIAAVTSGSRAQSPVDALLREPSVNSSVVLDKYTAWGPDSALPSTGEEPNLSQSTKVGSRPNGTLSAGSLITYTITLRKAGTAAETVRVTDTLGLYYRVHDAMDFIEDPPGTLGWQGDVAGEPIPLQFVAKVVELGSLPRGETILDNQAMIAFGTQAPIKIEDEQPPKIVVHGAYAPLVSRDHFLDPYEPNDTPEEAHGPLLSTKPYMAYFPREADADDYYYIEVGKGTRVDVDLSVPNDLDLDLWIYDSENRLIAGSSRSGFGRDESVTLEPEQEGKHYIRVRRFDGVSRSQQYTVVASY